MSYESSVISGYATVTTQRPVRIYPWCGCLLVLPKLLLTCTRNACAGKNLITLASLTGSPACGFLSSLSDMLRLSNVPKSDNRTASPLATDPRIISIAVFNVASTCAFVCLVSSAVRLIRLVMFMGDRVLVFSDQLLVVRPPSPPSDLSVFPNGAGVS